MTRRIRTDQSRRGAAAVELAVLLPFLAFLCVIATDWARLSYFTMCLNDAARSGALYASDPETRRTSRYTSVSDAARAECPDVASSATVTWSQTADVVLVEVRMDFKTITNFPGVPAQQTLVRKARMKVAPLMPQS